MDKVPIPRLEDVRQIGPKTNLDISGRCSQCGDFLLARLLGNTLPSRERLEEELLRVFRIHVWLQHREMLPPDAFREWIGL